jgi:hypothetical protein
MAGTTLDTSGGDRARTDARRAFMTAVLTAYPVVLDELRAHAAALRHVRKRRGRKTPPSFASEQEWAEAWAQRHHLVATAGSLWVVLWCHSAIVWLFRHDRLSISRDALVPRLMEASTLRPRLFTATPPRRFDSLHAPAPQKQRPPMIACDPTKMTRGQYIDAAGEHYDALAALLRDTGFRDAQVKRERDHFTWLAKYQVGRESYDRIHAQPETNTAEAIRAAVRRSRRRAARVCA